MQRFMMCAKGLRFAILFLCVLLGACTTTQLEFDRMQSTAFPQPQLRDGDTHTVSSIYLSANKIVVVDEDDTTIASLTGTTGAQKECITNAELDAIEAGNRSTQVSPASFSCGWWIFEATCTRYHVYGIVVDHFATKTDGSCKKTVLGRMWTSDNRSAFAIFYKHNTINSDNAKYLRTTSHELGHAFNLFHSDGDGSSTIMNQTSVVGDTFTYEFSSASQDHLDNSPDDCVYPGTGSFTASCR